MICANAFSASSYSKECNRAMAKLNCFLMLSSPEIINDTLPTDLSSGPHNTTSPVFRLMELISLASICCGLSLHDNSKVKVKSTTVTIDINLFMIVLPLNDLLNSGVWMGYGMGILKMRLLKVEILNGITIL